MKFDTIIIGGGLSGLTTAIALQKAGQKVAVVSFGQSTLHFHSGSMDLLGYDGEGNAVAHPFEAIKTLPASHPYSKLNDVEALATEAKQFLEEVGVKVQGEASANHYRLTPMGVAKPAWLTIDDYVTLENATQLPWKEVVVVNVAGYLDFPVKFIAAGLRKMGANVAVNAFSLPELDRARKSPTEMRASNIAKVLNNEEIVLRMAAEINAITAGAEMALLPAVLGLADDHLSRLLTDSVKVPVRFVATLPPSVPGVRVQTLLRRRFIQAGGTFLTGDKATGGEFEGNCLKSISTDKLEGTALQASNFVLATGSFQSGGLVSNYDSVSEAVFGFDVDATGNYHEWTNYGIFEPQPYMEFGVATDEKLRVKRNGVVVENCYAVGAVLSGNNRVKLASGTGVDLLTALQVAKTIND